MLKYISVEQCFFTTNFSSVQVRVLFGNKPKHKHQKMYSFTKITLTSFILLINVIRGGCYGEVSLYNKYKCLWMYNLLNDQFKLVNKKDIKCTNLLFYEMRCRY